MHAGGIDGWWKCELCGTFFKSQSNLAHHLATKNHYRDRLLNEFGANGSTCPKCEKVLKSQKELLKHLAAVHKEVFTYYREEMQGKALNEKENQEPACGMDLRKKIEARDESLDVENNGQDGGGKVRTNPNLQEPITKYQENMGTVEENMEQEPGTAKEECHDGGTSCLAEEQAGVVVSYLESTYLIENMTDDCQGAGVSILH